VFCNIWCICWNRGQLRAARSTDIRIHQFIPINEPVNIYYTVIHTIPIIYADIHAISNAIDDG